MLRESSQWIVYSRPGCGLCETFTTELAELLGHDAAAGVQVVDVDGSPELKRKYGERIPVLCIDGDFVCAIRVDIDRVKRYITAPAR